MENKKRALGRGLEQLFNSDNLDLGAIEKQIYENVSNEEVINIKLEDLRPNPYQPRKVFKDSALQELADSIKQHGVFQPIIVKKSIKGYEIIAGERRVRASKIAGLEKIPAIVKGFTDEQMMEIALLENLQRENLNSIEEAEAYKKMLDKLEITQEELAKKVGKSRSHITNIIGLLRLPREIQDLIEEEKISMGHARVLSKLEDDSKVIEIAKKIVSNNLPVREVEKLVDSSEFERKIKIERKKRETSSDFKYVEDLMTEKLDSKVRIKEHQVIISFTNTADLKRILEILDIKED
ncbi:MAG: ParB/RepB/Spo0J family partition protein [Bacilli bacterium]|nr:ParB/RepB/Spo0J family partition protein [Bacilli bacterium]